MHKTSQEQATVTLMSVRKRSSKHIVDSTLHLSDPTMLPQNIAIRVRYSPDDSSAFHVAGAWYDPDEQPPESSFAEGARNAMAEAYDRLYGGWNLSYGLADAADPDAVWELFDDMGKGEWSAHHRAEWLCF